MAENNIDVVELETLERHLGSLDQLLAADALAVQVRVCLRSFEDLGGDNQIFVGPDVLGDSWLDGSAVLLQTCRGRFPQRCRRK
jgi:hypothetical protein